jgi:hypothetical protein
VPQDTDNSTSPTGDVAHDEAALRDAEQKMHADESGAEHDRNPDPTGGHDPKALDEAATRMGTEPDS